jgi:hypothetical protein
MLLSSTACQPDTRVLCCGYERRALKVQRLDSHAKQASARPPRIQGATHASPNVYAITCTLSCALTPAAYSYSCPLFFRDS